MNDNNAYASMQREMYDYMYSFWDINNRDHAVGSFDYHNNWADYSYLWHDVNPTGACLDFGCGPGRNIVKFNQFFDRFDGTDICEKALEDAKKWITHNNLPLSKTQLYITNGLDLTGIESEQYDIVMSTICLQHICVYDIRLGFLKEFYRVLKNNGAITIQMGFGGKIGWDWANYYENRTDAKATNGHLDVSITDPTQIEDDLIRIGFTNFRYHLRPPGPGDDHVHWIFFSAYK